MYINVTPANWVAPSIADYTSTAISTFLQQIMRPVIMRDVRICLVLYCTLQAVNVPNQLMFYLYRLYKGGPHYRIKWVAVCHVAH